MYTFGLIGLRVGETNGASRERRGLLCVFLKLTRLAAGLAVMWIGLVTVSGVEVGLAWGRNTEPDIAGYRVYFGSGSGQYTSEIWVGDQTSVTISNLQEGLSYYFAVTATTTVGIESAPSEELVLRAHFEEVPLSIKLLEPASRGTIQVKFPTKENRVYTVESSRDLKSWGPITMLFGTGDEAAISLSHVNSFTRQFYRVRVAMMFQ